MVSRIPMVIGEARLAAAYVLSRTRYRPRMAFILGSGLLHPLELIEEPDSIHYADIPGCPVPSVPGHPGRLVLGRWQGEEVAILAGRPHFYEGLDMGRAAYLAALAVALEVKVLVVTNAAGGLNPRFKAGDLMLITDHLNLPGLAGFSPLRGFGGETERSPFLALDDAYCPQLRSAALETAKRLGIPLHQGIYAMVAGPNYETPAERRMLRRLGADAVGMSTVPEVLIARQGGLRVLGISCITNVAGALRPPSHDEVLQAAQRAGVHLARLLDELIPGLKPERP